MSFKKRVLTIFSDIKNEKFNEKLPKRIPIYNHHGDLFGYLCPVTKSTVHNKKEIQLLSKWRKENEFAFPSQFKITNDGTKRWVINQVIHNDYRILFFIETTDTHPKYIGHIGLYSFNFRSNSCEIDNVVRGNKTVGKGMMSFSLKAILHWTQTELQSAHIYLRVFADNSHAVDFYKKNGFKEVKKIPLQKMVHGDSIVWEENLKLKKAEKYFLKMEYV